MPNSQGRSRASGRSRDDPKQSKGRNKKGQHRVEEGESNDSGSDSEDLYLFRISKAEDTLDLRLNGFTLSMVIDSGAHHNTLSVHDFKRLQKARPDVSLQPASTKLYPYASKQALMLLGKCTLEVEVPKTACHCFVLRGATSTSITLKQQNQQRARTVKSWHRREHPELFWSRHMVKSTHKVPTSLHWAGETQELPAQTEN